MLRAALDFIGQSGADRVSHAESFADRDATSDGALECLGIDFKLALALIADCEAHWAARLRQKSISNAQADCAIFQLLARVTTLFESDPSTRGRIRLFFVLAGSTHPEIVAAVRRAHNAIQGAVLAAFDEELRRGRFLIKDPRALGALINAAIRGVGYQWLMEPDSIDVKSVLVELENLLVHSLEQA